MNKQRRNAASKPRSGGISRRAALGRVGAGGLAAGLLVGGAGGAEAQSALTTAATEAAARRAISAINQGLASGDATLLNATFAPDYVNHTPHRSLQTGQQFAPDLAGLAAALGELRAFVPDGVILVDDVVASGDRAAIRGAFRGTLNPNAAGQAGAANGRLRIGGAAFVRVSLGSIVESWDYSEAAELYGGLVIAVQPTPTPTPPPTPAAGRGEPRDVSDFQQVSLEGIGRLLIVQGDAESLSIDAEPKVLKRIETAVENGTLYIRPSRSFNTREQITYYLMAKTLNGIALSGAGSAEAMALSADDFTLKVDGAGSASIAGLTANTLDVAISGRGTVELGGNVDQQTVTVSGSGQYQASKLASRTASVTTDGAAQATVSVSESLDAEASGASRIVYAGDPKVRPNSSGAASIVPAG